MGRSSVHVGRKGSFGAAFVNQVPHPQSKRRRDGNLYFARGIYLDHKYSVTGARELVLPTMPGFQMRASVLCHAEARTSFFFTLASLNGILDILLALESCAPLYLKSRDSTPNCARPSVRVRVRRQRRSVLVSCSIVGKRTPALLSRLGAASRWLSPAVSGTSLRTGRLSNAGHLISHWHPN